ncbi:MAG: Beta-ketoadipate enol-lactone hydrolase [Candidatus Ozemobacter sibiricus]|jgi:pimeloyl-ACP methyl ester carboxylesterase|uniref:Beta-ketoadipate enol-lactone hydrolase n=1 Tax=Candidatus Ozemobacter sibiricus TaxID=2268124 RepID=A0A367ZNA2_9BACT|nr:MAG: Beta-ketoadipate enol-lactone hydrolase [Candidatus Ozemobacter sibiricus]
MANRIKTAGLTILDTRISYFEVGAGRPVVLLHGNPGTKLDFQTLAETFGSDQVRFLAIDRPGHGNSDELLPETPDPWYDTKAYAEFLKRVAGGQAYVVGYSLGAFCALKLALRFPELVTGLGLIAPFVAPRDPRESPSGLPAWSRHPLLGTIMGLLLPTLAGGKVRQHLIDVWHPATIPETVLAEAHKRYTHFEALISTLRDKNDMLQVRGEVTGRLGEIRCPTLAILGGKDAICDPAAQGAVLAAIPGLRRVDLPEGGHGLPFTHTREVGEALLDHLQTIPTGPA